MKINLSGKISRALTFVRNAVVPSRVVANDLVRCPNADVLVKASSHVSKIRHNDPVLEEIACCNALVLNKPEHPHPFMDIQDFMKTTSPFEHKVIGTLPAEIQSLFPDKPSDAIKFLGELATFLRTDDGLSLCTSRPINLSSGKDFNIKFIGQGSFGYVFKTDHARNKFAFKVFKDKVLDQGDILLHGSIPEARTDAYLCDREYKDYRIFHMSDFSSKGNWTLSEFVETPDDLMKMWALYKARKGVLLNSIHPEISFSDFDRPLNYLLGGQVRVDPGGAHIKGRNDVSSISSLEAEYPDSFSSLSVNSCEPVQYIRNLPKAQRQAAFNALLARSDSRSLMHISDTIEFLPLLARKNAFYTLLEHPDSLLKVGLGNEAKFLLYDDVQKAFKDVIEHPDCPVNLALLREAKKFLSTAELKVVKDKIMKKILAPYSTFSLG